MGPALPKGINFTLTFTKYQTSSPAEKDIVTFAGQKMDFALITRDGEILPFSKFILSARSPPLRAMLGNNFEEAKKNSMTVSNATPEAVKMFLATLYPTKEEYIKLPRGISRTTLTGTTSLKCIK